MSSAVHITGPIIYAQMHIVPYDTPHSCAAIPTVAIHRLQNSSKPFATFSINISAKIIMVVLFFNVLPLYTSGVRSVNVFWVFFTQLHSILSSTQKYHTLSRRFMWLLIIKNRFSLDKKNIATGRVPMTMQSYEGCANSMFAPCRIPPSYRRGFVRFCLVIRWG